MSSADSYLSTFAYRDETSFVESIATEQTHASDDVFRGDGRQLEIPTVLPHVEMLPNKLCKKKIIVRQR